MDLDVTATTPNFGVNKVVIPYPNNEYSGPLPVMRIEDFSVVCNYAPDLTSRKQWIIFCFVLGITKIHIGITKIHIACQHFCKICASRLFPRTNFHIVLESPIILF